MDVCWWGVIYYMGYSVGRFLFICSVNYEMICVSDNFCCNFVVMDKEGGGVKDLRYCLVGGCWSCFVKF